MINYQTERNKSGSFSLNKKNIINNKQNYKINNGKQMKTEQFW